MKKVRLILFSSLVFWLAGCGAIFTSKTPQNVPGAPSIFTAKFSNLSSAELQEPFFPTGLELDFHQYPSEQVIEKVTSFPHVPLSTHPRV